MRNRELYWLIEKKLLPKCMEIMKTKGEAYSGQTDALGNFKRIAKTAASPLYKVWFTFYCKHQDALASYIRGEYKDSEPIQGRIQDLINYLFILYGLIYEKEKETKTQKKQKKG